MAVTLKSTGLAAELLYCVMVDPDDGVTLKEWVNGWTSTWNGSNAWTDNDTEMAVDDPVTVAAMTWKGTNLYAFQTKDNGSFNSYHVRFTSALPLPGGADQSGFTKFVAGSLQSSGGGRMSFSGEEFEMYREISGGKIGWRSASGTSFSTTTVPIDGTKFSAGGTYERLGTQTYFFGLESGSAAADGTWSNGGFVSDTLIGAGGTISGQGKLPGSYIIQCWFDRPLSEAEYQTLHDDFFGVLFDAGGGGGAREVDAETESLALTGQAATVNRERGVSAATEALSITGQAATVTRVRNVAAQTEALALTGQQATVARDRGVSAATEALSLAGQPASITRGRGVAAGTEALSLTGHAATVNRSREVAATMQALAITGQAATVTRGSALNVMANTEVLAITGHQAAVNRSRLVLANVAQADIRAFLASVERGQPQDIGGHFIPQRDYRPELDAKRVKEREELRRLIERAAGLIEEAEEAPVLQTQAKALRAELAKLEPSARTYKRHDEPRIDIQAVQRRIDALITKAADDLIVQAADVLTDLIQEIIEES